MKKWNPEGKDTIHQIIKKIVKSAEKRLFNSIQGGWNYHFFFFPPRSDESSPFKYIYFITIYHPLCKDRLIHTIKKYIFSKIKKIDASFSKELGAKNPFILYLNHYGNQSQCSSLLQIIFW